MSEELVLFQVENGIGIITINRHKALNALNVEVLKALGKILDQVRKDESVKVLILTGAGEKAFVAGADISEMKNFSPIQAKEFSQLGQGIFRSIEELPKPVIAAVNGFALGGGTELAISCDYILASENAVFGQPEVNLGIFPGFGGTQRLVKHLGKMRAKELCFFGERIPAKRALEIGLCNEVVEAGRLMERAKELAKKLMEKGLLAIALCKQAIEQGSDLDLDKGLLVEQTLFGLCFDTQDQKEGMSAFLEKRKPGFSGK